MKAPLSTVFAVVILSFTVGVSVAVAGDKPPISVPAIAQYIEVNPTLAGPQLTGPSTTRVPAGQARTIQKRGGTDAAALLSLARAGATERRTATQTRASVSAAHESNFVGALTGSTGLSYGNAIALGTLLVLISVACGAAAARRRTSAPVSQ